jgi:hypothetical protein
MTIVNQILLQQCLREMLLQILDRCLVLIRCKLVFIERFLGLAVPLEVRKTVQEGLRYACQRQIDPSKEIIVFVINIKDWNFRFFTEKWWKRKLLRLLLLAFSDLDLVLDASAEPPVDEIVFV